MEIGKSSYMKLILLFLFFALPFYSSGRATTFEEDNTVTLTQQTITGGIKHKVKKVRRHHTAKLKLSVALIKNSKAKSAKQHSRRRHKDHIRTKSELNVFMQLSIRKNYTCRH